MKTFESFLAPQFEAYLLRRQQLGYNPSSQESDLRAFDRYLIKTQADWDSLLKPSFYLELRSTLKLEASSSNKLFISLRNLFDYFIRQQIVRENPLKDIPRLEEKLFIPFVFSPAQIDQIVSTHCSQIRKTKHFFLTDLAVYLAVVMLARLGMRISEPLKILRAHYRKEDGTLYIERTKFHKERLIPAPKAVLMDIDNYLKIRQALLGKSKNPYLLVGREDKTITTNQIKYAFNRTIKTIGIEQPKQVAGNMTFGAPIPHSLRHSFAINMVKGFREQGKDPEHALPFLAAYMGHKKYKYTAAYLKVLHADQRQGLIEFSKAFRDMQ